MAETITNVEIHGGRDWPRISWGAILGGTLIALMIYLTLNLLGVGIGASTIDVQQGDTPSGTAFGIGAAIWWVVSGLIALFVGGWVAGRFARVPHRMDRALHGLAVWAALNLLVLYLLTSAVGRIVGGAASVLGQGVSGAGQALLSQAGPGGDALGQLTQGLTGTPEQRAAVLSAGRDYLSQRTPETRARLVQTLGAAGMSESDANQLLARIEQGAPAAREQAAAAADTTASAVTRAALWLFLSMVLGAAVAAWGAGSAAGPVYREALEPGARPVERVA